MIARNARVGRLEIDVIARRAQLLVFCEVRARASRRLLDPVETIDRPKRARIRAAALRWLALTNTDYEELRFDAASVVFEGTAPELTYYEDAF